jgi:hypothetical protein
MTVTLNPEQFPQLLNRLDRLSIAIERLAASWESMKRIEDLTSKLKTSGDALAKATDPTAQ